MSQEQEMEEGAKQMFSLFNLLVKAGFSEEQALSLIQGMLTALLMKNLEALQHIVPDGT